MANLNVKHSGRIPRNVFMLGMVSLFTDAASEMIYPLVPLFVAALGSGAIVLGVIEGVAETTASLLKLASGVISDKLGKRKILVLIGYALSSVARPFTGLAAAGWHIVSIRMLDRVGKGIRTAPRDALIASSVDPQHRGRAFGFHRAMDHAGAVIGPLVAVATLTLLIVVWEFNDVLQTLRWTFLAAFLPGLLAVLTIIFFVQEKVDSPAVQKPFAVSLRQFDANFMRYLGIVFLFTLGNSSDAFLLFRIEESMRTSGSLHTLVGGVPVLAGLLQRFGNEASQKMMVDVLFLPLIWSYFHIVKVLFSTPLGTLSDTIGRKHVIVIGWSIYAFVYCGFALLDFVPVDWQVAATFSLFAIYALFYAFTEGAEKALVADLVTPEQRGSAFGMFNFAIGIGALPASLVFGFVYTMFGALVAFVMGAVIAVIAMVLLSLRVSEKGHPR